ncbi:major capsid protein [Capybara microvirus Cap3_SP_541]|nr:major capsid protein [Capybara microvirus Cap3_SP_541]
MNRNVESRFAYAPSAEIPRSIFSRPFRHVTTFNVGELIPIALEEVLPGDTFQVTTSKVARLQTLLAPVFDSAYLDTYWFFVPMRLIWKHTKQFFGENTESAWIPQTEYSIPLLRSPSGGFDFGSLADYFGIPPKVDFSSADPADLPSSLPFRAYALICNEFFRDQNLDDPFVIDDGDADTYGSNGSDYFRDCAKGGKPFVASKYHDYFTSALPGPQKGPSVSIPISMQGLVTTSPYQTTIGDWPVQYGMKTANGELIGSFYPGFFKTDSDPASAAFSSAIRPTGNYAHIDSTNFVVNSGTYSAFDVNSLRLAFQTQKMLERFARSGSRYTETIQAFFGVTSPDSRLQRPEYLGGNRVPIGVHQVTNTSQSTDGALGNVAAMSYTSDQNSDFIKSFTEHGYIIGLTCVRYDHTYSQGLDRLWSRHSRYDFYWPVFDAIGEQPMYKREIYFTADHDKDNQVFGYQEAWAAYRYGKSRVSSEMRPQHPQTLASWNFADYYDTSPTLSSSWIREDLHNVDRSLAVQSSSGYKQIMLDLYCDMKCTRPMSVYSVPGLIDHF